MRHVIDEILKEIASVAAEAQYLLETYNAAVADVLNPRMAKITKYVQALNILTSQE